MSLLYPLVVYKITGIDLHTGIDDGDRFDILRRQLFRQSLGVREAVVIKGKYPEAFHIVYIHMYRVQRQLVFAHGIHRIQNLTLCKVAPTALMEAINPLLLQAAFAGQCQIAFQHLLGVLTGNHIVIQRAAGMRPEIIVLLFFAEVKAGAVAVVRQNAQAAVFGIDHKEIDGFVKRLKIVTMGAGVIRIPVLIGIVALVQEAGFVPQTVNNRVRGQGLHDLHRPHICVGHTLGRKVALRPKLFHFLRRDPQQELDPSPGQDVEG